MSLKNIIEYIELHSLEGINECFNSGVSPNDLFNGQPLIYELISEYTRGPLFSDCIRTFMHHGLVFEDQLLLSVLADYPEHLSNELKNSPDSIHKRYTLRCAYTPLERVTLMHICAEFNLVNCAHILFEKGLAVDEKAGLDEFGFGGQTPIFHTVNQNGNRSAEMLSFLLERGARVDTQVNGFVWGKSYPWETLIPAVNPISYAMMGMLPQMHRDEVTISGIVMRLMKVAYGTEYIPVNIPCKYLQ